MSKIFNGDPATKFAIIPEKEFIPLIDATKSLLQEVAGIKSFLDNEPNVKIEIKSVEHKFQDLIKHIKETNQIETVDTTFYELTDAVRNGIIDLNIKETDIVSKMKKMNDCKFNIIISILDIILERLNMALVKELQTPVFKIKNLDTGKYSNGGKEESNVSGLGKIWNDIGAVKKHLSLFSGEEGRYKDGNWVVVAIDGIETPAFSVKDYYAGDERVQNLKVI